MIWTVGFLWNRKRIFGLIESSVVLVFFFVISSGLKSAHLKEIQDQREIPITLSSIKTHSALNQITEGNRSIIKRRNYGI